MNRKKRAALAQQTLEICQHGRYTTDDGQVVRLAAEIDQTVNGTQTYDLATMPSRPEPRFEQSAQIEVTGESTFEAIARATGESSGRLACLNFASAKNPGGGFLGGSQAQEEALARSSALYPALQSQFANYYEPNRASGTCLYLDRAIVSPQVPFFRDDSGKLLNSMVPATVITAPAPNAGAIARHEANSVSEINAALDRRGEMVLRAAALDRVDQLVLGAWGCGVFRNDPSTVAEAFRAYLSGSGEYAYSFQRVIFAVFDPTKQRANIRAFQRCFGVG